MPFRVGDVQVFETAGRLRPVRIQLGVGKERQNDRSEAIPKLPRRPGERRGPVQRFGGLPGFRLNDGNDFSIRRRPSVITQNRRLPRRPEW